MTLLICNLIFSQGLLKLGPYTGAAFPNDSLLKEIYGEGDVVYGLKLGVHIWNGFYVFVSGMQYKTVGETTQLGDITRLVINPVNLSLRYTMPLRTFNPYMQFGYTHLYFTEESAIHTTEDDGNGFSLVTGVEIQLSKRFILDLGLRYSSVKIQIQVSDELSEEFDLGSFQIGLSFLVFL